MTRKEIASNSDASPRRLIQAKTARVSTISIVRSLLLSVLLLAGALGATRTKKPPLQPVDINRATVAELEQVPGIGQRTAEAIVHLREKSGPYKRLEDLLAIRGISQQRLEKLRAYLTVAPPVRPKKK